MNKIDLIDLLKSLNIPISECTPTDENMETDTHLYFWDYMWDDITASGSNYNTKVTYQISFIANKPRNEKLLELKNKLNKKGIFPLIQHEYIAKERRVHSFFAIEVLENIGENNEYISIPRI